MPSFLGYHGTDLNNFYTIKNYNFSPSLGDKHWLGEGVYFFIEGLSDPKEKAKQWAIDEAYDSKVKKIIYNKYIVIEVEIICNVDDILDLTTIEGLKAFNYARNQIIEKTKGENDIYDSHILKNIVEKLNYQFIKANFYIQFGKQRRFKLRSRIPNVTVIVIRNPKENIDRNKIKNLIQGDLK